jgi:hypothetical protein
MDKHASTPKSAKKDKKDKKMKKEKKEKSAASSASSSASSSAAAAAAEDTPVESSSATMYISPIAKPLAGVKLHKKLFKAVRKGESGRLFRSQPACATPSMLVVTNMRACLRPVCLPFAATDAKMLKRGVKEVVKALRKGSKG